MQKGSGVSGQVSGSALTPYVLGVLALLIVVTPALAEEAGGQSKDEIAKELANPNTVLTSLKLQIQYYSFDGNLPRAGEQNMLKLFLQPTLPFPLENGKMLWVRLLH